MKLSSKSLHFKLYNFWHKLKYGWTVNNEVVNLCPYMRTVLFYWWLRLLFMTKVAYVTIPILLFEIPRWAGMCSYAAKNVIYFLYFVAALMASVVGTGVGIAYLTKETHLGQSVGVKIANKTESFVELLGAWFTSMHNNICPVVTIQGEQ